jgi:putative acetyltransferase
MCSVVGFISWRRKDNLGVSLNRRHIDNLYDLVIRTARNADCGRIAALVSGVLSEFNLPFEPESKDSDLRNIELSYLQSGGIFEVIEDRDGHLLGTYGLFPLTRETCELRKMYFVAEIRGLGLGKRVLTRAVNHALRLGFKTIVLETISVLDRAVRLYTHFGFVPTETRHTSARVDQAYILKLSE